MALILVIQNISNLAPVSDYRYEASVGDGTPARSKVLARGEVKGFERARPFHELLNTVLDDIEREQGARA